jgi:hypothetical protein
MKKKKKDFLVFSFKSPTGPKEPPPPLSPAPLPDSAESHLHHLLHLAKANHKTHQLPNTQDSFRSKNKIKKIPPTAPQPSTHAIRSPHATVPPAPKPTTDSPTSNKSTPPFTKPTICQFMSRDKVIGSDKRTPPTTNV